VPIYPVWLSEVLAVPNDLNTISLPESDVCDQAKVAPPKTVAIKTINEAKNCRMIRLPSNDD
jgi:hypothetical protein